MISSVSRKKRVPKKSLKNKALLLGVTGSVAAYKSVELIRRLTDAGASVSVVMTGAARKFITPLSLELASGNPVLSDLFDDPMAHITLARGADLALVAPVTANTVAKLACGIADDLLSTALMSFDGPLVLAPAMNWRMYEHHAFKRNLDRLIKHGAVLVPPEKGSLACGEEGVGRMAPVQEIIDAVSGALSARVGDLAGLRVVVTAGPTRERLDPVRFISNRSSGKMGYALARVALLRGADVTLISGPSALEPPRGAKFVGVESATEMLEAVLRETGGADALLMAAAVADVSPVAVSESKIEKSTLESLKLKPTPDILREVCSRNKRPFVIGFAAESGPDVRKASEKLRAKGADCIVLNDISAPESGFDVDTNRVTIINSKGVSEHPLMTKDEAAGLVLDRVAARFA